MKRFFVGPLGLEPRITAPKTGVLPLHHGPMLKADANLKQSFNFSNTTASNPITHGANALKLENEIIQEQQTESSHNQMMSEEVVQNTSMESESIVEDNSVNEMEKSFTQEAMETTHEETQENNVEEEVSNDLKEFGVDSDAPDLFSSETETSSSDELLSSEHEEEEDDLEIPAFLRRQKN